ncbi:MAG: nodulation protein NfeD [Candidatus Omnitrophica bacterium]|nr:nodulation protein NfeD [Candidatus Omnitrophota bacterium]
MRSLLGRFPFLFLFLLSAPALVTPDGSATAETPSAQFQKVKDMIDEVGREVDNLERQATDFVNQATETLKAAIKKSEATPEESSISDSTREIAAKPAIKSSSNPVVYTLPIEGQVRPIMMTLFQRGLKEAEDHDVDLVLLIMDTPGGELGIAEEISRNLLECKVPTATWIRNEGLSAGMLIAISTQRTYMADISLVGDCQPIFAGAGEIKEAPEKILTVVREYGERAARKNGYPVDAVLAMIDENIDYTSPDGEIRAATGQLLTLRAEEAVQIGFAEAVCNTTDEVLIQMGLGHATVKKFTKNWAEIIAAFIASPSIASLLTLIGLAGLFIEYKTPGFGLPGGVGLIALALVFWGHSIAHLAGLEGMVLFFLGVVLLAIEIFIIPGFGIFGIAGLGLMLIGLLITFLTVPLDSPFFVPSVHLSMPLTQIAVALIGSIVVVFFAAMYLPDIPVLERWGLSMRSELKTDKGFSSHEVIKGNELTGQTGVTLSSLKPGGLARIGKKRMDVVTQGEYIDAGQTVRVVEVRGMQVIVRKEIPPV